MARKKRLPSLVRRLHRTLGAGASVFVIFMVSSGLIINHSNGLGLNERNVSQPNLLHWYGINAPDEILSYPVGDHWISFAGSQFYFNAEPVLRVSDGNGAVRSGDLLVAATSDQLILLNTSGQLIEKLPWEQSENGPIDAIGTEANGKVAVKSNGRIWLSDTQFLSWEPADDLTEKLTWSQPVQAPETLLDNINRHYRGDGLSLERLLLDIHSGRIFGPVGVFIYDMLALTIGFLAISGLILWVRSRKNGKGKVKQR